MLINVYDYINSDAIARYCLSIEHQFTPLQTAYLVSRCRKHTLARKHLVFQKILIEKMPDDEIRFPGERARNNGSGKVSLKWFLKKYMQLQNKCLNDFFQSDDNSIYQAELYSSLSEFYDYAGRGQGNYYRTVEEALSDIEKDITDKFSGEIIHIRKNYFDEKQRYISVLFNSNKEVIDIYNDSGLSDEEMDIMDGFDQVCFVCPVPFKKGDIVWAPDISETPFVFLSVWYEGKSEEDREKYMEHWDSSDMLAHGYFQRDDGRIYREYMHDYISLGYYYGSLNGNKRTLKAISNFLKGELDLADVLNAYHLFINEENANEIRKELRLTGLLDEDEQEDERYERNFKRGESEIEEQFIHAGNIWELMLYYGLFGFCVGDAIGVPVEFSSREHRKKDPVLEMRAYGTHNQPIGTWSDDTSLMLCFIDAVNRGYSIQKVADNFVDFYKNGAFTPYGKVFDIGIATRDAVEKMDKGENPVQCGGILDTDNGNGSLMRMLPLAFYGLQMKPLELISFVENVSSLTHGHPRSRFACIFYVRFAIRLMAGKLKEDAKEIALDKTIEFMKKYCYEKYTNEWMYFDRILSKTILNLPENEIKSTGYVVDTLEAVLWSFFHGDSYRQIVLKAVNLGDDTDTVTALAGGLAGLFYCVKNGIPEEWIQNVVKKEKLYQLFRKFCKKCDLPGNNYAVTIKR